MKIYIFLAPASHDTKNGCIRLVWAEAFIFALRRPFNVIAKSCLSLMRTNISNGRRKKEKHSQTEYPGEQFCMELQSKSLANMIRISSDYCIPTFAISFHGSVEARDLLFYLLSIALNDNLYKEHIFFLAYA